MQIANAAFTSELLCRTPPGSPRLAVLKSSKVRARRSSAAAAGVTGAGGRPSVVLHPPLAAARTFFGGLSFVATFISVLSPPYPVRYFWLLYHLHRSAMSPASPAQLPCPVGLAETGSGLARRRQPDPSRELDGISSHAVKTGPLDLKNLPGAPSLPLSWNFLAASPFPSLFLRHYLA